MLAILTSGPLRQLIVLGALSVACGGDSNSTRDDDASSPATATAAADEDGLSGDASNAPFACTTADLEALERGLARDGASGAADARCSGED